MTLPELPTGTVTLLFTDIEGSTKLLQALGRERYFEVRDLGERRLKDLSAPERIYALVVEDGRPVEPAEPVREERKLVSVLVAELVGLSASDPEDFRASLEPFQAYAQKEIERFGGS